MIRAVDGHLIHYLESAVNDNVVLMCHGITSSKEEGGFYDYLSKRMNDEGLSTFRFDFRGHGESLIPSNQATISGMIADIDCVIRYLQERYQKISIVAASFGASVLLLLMQQIKLPIRSCVLLNPVLDYRSTFTSATTEWSRSFLPEGGMINLFSTPMIKIGLDFVLNPLMGIELFFYDPCAQPWIHDVPAIILHGKKDQIVPIEDSRKYVKSNAERIKLIELPKSSHGLEEDVEDVIKISCQFIKKWFE